MKIFETLLSEVVEEKAYKAALQLRRHSRLKELKAPEEILNNEKEIEQRYIDVSEAELKFAGIIIKTKNIKTKKAAGELLARHLSHEFLPFPYQQEFLVGIGSKNNSCGWIGEWPVVFLTENACEASKAHEFAHVALGHKGKSRSEAKNLRQEVNASLLAKKWLQEKKQWNRKFGQRIEKSLRVMFVTLKVRRPQQAEKLETWFENRLGELRGETLAERKLLKALFPERFSS